MADDLHLTAQIRVSENLRHDSRAIESATRSLQRSIAEKLIPEIWGKGKFVVDLRVEKASNYMNGLPVVVIEARGLITKVQTQRIVMPEVMQIDYRRMEAIPLAIGAVDEVKRRLRLWWKLKAKKRIDQELRGLFPWHYTIPRKPPIQRRPKTRRQQIDELLRGLFPWQYE